MLAAHSVAGRASSSVVHLEDPSASSIHAAVSWTGERWEARDLGSSNGTFVNEVRAVLQENTLLMRGAFLRFGGAAERWELTDDGGPVVAARSVVTGEVCSATDGLLALPDPENVLVAIVLDSGGQWLVETPDGVRRPARNAELIVLEGQTWELTVPPFLPMIGTRRAALVPDLATLTLHFHVSRDGEHVRVEAVDKGSALSLGERTKFDVLLQLARERKKDAIAASLGEADQGWLHVIDLMRDLRVSEQNLNTMVHRLRKAFAAAGVEGAEGIVERRKREIRIGIGNDRLVVLGG